MVERFIAANTYEGRPPAVIAFWRCATGKDHLLLIEEPDGTITMAGTTSRPIWDPLTTQETCGRCQQPARSRTFPRGPRGSEGRLLTPGGN